MSIFILMAGLALLTGGVLAGSKSTPRTVMRFAGLLLVIAGFVTILRP